MNWLNKKYENFYTKIYKSYEIIIENFQNLLLTAIYMYMSATFIKHENLKVKKLCLQK